MAGASRINFSRAQQQTKPIDTNPTTVIFAVGVSQRGPIGSSPAISSFPEFERVYGAPTSASADTYLEIKALFEEAGTKGAPVLNFSRVVHCSDPTDPTTKSSASASLNIPTAAVAATSGFILAAVGPYVLANGDTLKLHTDGGGLQTFTLAVTAAALASGAGPFTLADGQTLTFTLDNGAVLTKVFHTAEFVSIAAATAAEVVAAVNAFLAGQNGYVASDGAPAGGVASVTTVTHVTITSNRLGTGSDVHVTGGTANASLGFSTTHVAGTGDASNIVKTTAAELVTKLAGLTGGVASAVAGALKTTSSTTGSSSSVQLDAASSTTTKLGLDNAVHTGIANGTVNTLAVAGKTDGTYANALSIQIAAASNASATAFNLYVLQGGVAVERFFNLSMDPTSALYAPTVINTGALGQGASNLITVTDLLAGVPSPGNLPGVATVGPMTGGNDGLASLADADFTGGVSSNGRTGMRALDVIDGGCLLIAPGRATASTHNGMVNYCENVRGASCFTLLDPPTGMTSSQIVTYVTSTASLKELSELAAIYWPKIYVDNPNVAVFGTAATLLTGPSGSVAGLCARLDQSKPGGAFEHPASIEKGFLSTARGLETTEVQDDVKRGIVFDALINPIMVKRGTPVYVDGARTLKDTGPFPTVGGSRGIVFLQLQLGPLLDPKRNQNIRPRLFNEIKARVDEFMSRLTRAECFASNIDAQAWFFDVGAALNPPSTQKARTVNEALGVATSEPAEFFNVIISPFTPPPST